MTDLLPRSTASASAAGAAVATLPELTGANTAAIQAARSAGFWTLAWRRFRRDYTSMAALVIFGLICLVALMAPVLTESVLKIDPNRQRLEARFQPPGPTSWLGTDEYGRDQLARLIHGAQVSIGLAFIVTGLSIAIGSTIGLWAGYYGGWVDDVINAAIQIKRAVPFLYLLIIIAMIWAPTPLSLGILFGVWSWTGEARLVRGQALTLRDREYIIAAKVLGARDGALLFRHILPNLISIVLVSAGSTIAGTILLEAAISFLGFGIQPPMASWGNMLTNSLEYIRRGWWLVAGPGVIISITVLCVFLLADGLRDALDPRLK